VIGSFNVGIDFSKVYLMSDIKKNRHFNNKL